MITESHLKRIIEGELDDDSSNIPMKRRRLELMGKNYNLPVNSSEAYDNFILLANQARDYHLNMNAFDPAFSKFATESHDFHRAAELVNDVYCMGRRDHQFWVDVLVIYTAGREEVSAQCRIWINRNDYGKGTGAYNVAANKAITAYLQGQLMRHSLWAHRLGESCLDWVELDRQQLL